MSGADDASVETTGTGSDCGDSINDTDGSFRNCGEDNSNGFSDPASGFGTLQFPREDMLGIVHNLNQLHAPVFNPHLLISCLKASCTILRRSERTQRSEVEYVRKFIREVVVNAFDKYFREDVMRRSNEASRSMLLSALTFLVALAAEVLKNRFNLADEVEAPEAYELEQDLHCLLAPLSWGFDGSTTLYKFHRMNEVPAEVQQESVAFLEELGLPMPNPEQEVCDVEQNGSRWILHLTTYFSNLEGYHTAFAVLRDPLRFSLGLLDSIVLILRLTCLYIPPDAHGEAIQAMKDLLLALDGLVQHDPEKLAEQGRDRTYWHFSRMLDFCYLTLSVLLSRTDADSLVGTVQRHFVEVMLKSSNFNKLLSAMRECSRLLQRSRDIQQEDNRVSLQNNISWLEEQKVVKQMLRANLHQTQYVEQVVSILTLLSEEGFLMEEHLDMLWNVTEQEETFDAVKLNVYNILAEIASSMGPSQLDLLFRKFQVSKARSVADTQRLLDLLKRLAACDSQEGSMADKLLQMIWDLTMPCDTPRELLLANAIPDVLKEYSNKGQSGHVRHYMERCVEHLRKQQDCYTSLHLLRGLLALQPDPKDDDHRTRQVTVLWLKDQHDILHLLVNNLKAHMKRAREACTTAARSTLPGEGLYSYQDIVQEYLLALRYLAECCKESFPTDLALELWDSIIGGANTEQDIEQGCTWFSQGVMPAGTLRLDTAKALLVERIIKLPLTSLPQPAFSCLCKYFIEVNLHSKNLARVSNADGKGRVSGTYFALNLDLTGLEYMWQVFLHAAHPEVAGYAQRLLISVYHGTISQGDDTTHQVHAAFIRHATRHLLEGARLLTGKVAESADWRVPGAQDSSVVTTLRSAAAVTVERCLSILHEFADCTQGRTMPPTPAHKASFRGSDTVLELQVMQQQSKLRVAAHTNEYIGSVRHRVAALMKVATTQIRLLHGGKEWDNDSALVGHFLHIRPSVLHCTTSPTVNSFSRFDKEYAEDWQMHSPTALLSRTETIYDVLFYLADYPHATAVRLRALELLQMLPTCPPIPATLREALASDQPPSRLEAVLLAGSADAPPPPSKLLYILQALHGVLFPVQDEVPPAPGTPQPAELRTAFLASGCPSLLFCTVQHACAAMGKDVLYLRSVHSHLVLMLSSLVNYTQQQVQERPQEAMSDSEGVMRSASQAGAASTGGKADQRMEEAETERNVPSEASEPAAPPATAAQGSPVSNDSPVPPPAAEEEPAPPAPRLDGETLRLTMAYLVQLAHDAAFGWRTLSMEQVAKEAGPDVKLVKDALQLLHFVVESHPELYSDLLAMLAARRMAGDLLLNRWLRPVRHAMAELLDRTCIAGGSSAAAHYWLLELLVERRADADRLGAGASDYYELFTKLVASLSSSSPQAFPLAERLLQELVEGFATMAKAGAPQSKDEGFETVLEGQLKLVRMLVDTLERHSVGAPQEGDLVHMLLADFLFPEALLWSEHLLSGSVSPERLPDALECRCTTISCRRAALDLVLDLMTNSPTNLEAGAALLHRLHLDHEPVVEERWEQQPNGNLRAPDGYVGLKNAGATCYMNAVFQQLFMQPRIRQLVLSATEVPLEERPDSVFYQLQYMFAWLLLSKHSFFVPRQFWQSFKDYDGQPIDVREHQDAYEFFTRLQDCVDQHLTSTNQCTAMKAVMGGRFVQHIICRDIDYRSEREEEFYQISVDVRGKRSLEESLQSYVQGELMEGDNAYFCEDIGRRVTAVKRSCIKELPHTLSFHLKRFEFDHHTQTRYKVRDRFEFPLALDMYRYTADGLEELERQAAATAGGSAGIAAPAPRPHPASYYNYELKGVVVHSGTAFAGHYYSYIKERPTPGPDGRAPDARWFCFDDKAVRPWDVSMVEQDCFGGTLSQDYAAQGKIPARQDVDRPHSAYMLFYERRDEGTDPQPAAATCATTSPASPMDNALPSRQSSSEGVSTSGQAGVAPCGTDGHADTAMEQAVATVQPPYGMPRCIWENVMHENLRMVYRLHLLDKDYFRFIRLVVESSACVSSKKVRKTDALVSCSSMSCDAAGSSGPAGSGDASEASGSRRSSGAAHAVRLCVRLAVHFLLKVYLTTHSSLRGDLQQWREAIVNAVEASSMAVRVVLEELLAMKQWVQAYFLGYPQQQPRWIFTVMISAALRRALQPPPAPPTSPPPASPMDAVPATSAMATGTAAGTSGGGGGSSPLPSPSSRASDELLQLASQVIAMITEQLQRAAVETGSECRGLLQVLHDLLPLHSQMHRLMCEQHVILNLTQLILRLSSLNNSEDSWMDELTAAFGLLGVLYSDAVNMYRANYPNQNAGMPIWLTGEYLLNVYRLLCNTDVVYALVLSLVQSDVAMRLLSTLLPIDSQNREHLAHIMLELVLELLATGSEDMVAGLCDVATRVASTPARANVLLYGVRNGPHGLLDLVMGPLQTPRRTRLLWLINLCLERNPTAGQQIMASYEANRTNFDPPCVLRWLQKEVDLQAGRQLSQELSALHDMRERLIEKIDELMR